MRKLWIVALVVLAVLGSVAQAQVSAQKKELVARMMQLQQPAVELAAQALTERPAVQMLQQAEMVLQTRVEPDKREAIAKEIQSSVDKYVDEAAPLVRERAVRLAPATIGALMYERFSEDELRQLIAIIESPVNNKYLQMGGELHRALIERLVDEMQGTIEPKVKSLEQAIIKSLGQSPDSAPVNKELVRAASKL